MLTLPPRSSAVWSGELDLHLDPLELCGSLLRDCPHSLLLDGGGGFARSWLPGPLVAVDPQVLIRELGPGSGRDLLARIEARVQQRRREGGTEGTGLAVLLAYDATRESDRRFSPDGGSFRALVLEVDCSVRFVAGQFPLLSLRRPANGASGQVRGEGRRMEDRLGALAGENPVRQAARREGVVRTSLPREAYQRTVRRVQQRIAEGEIYQANLCQRFSTRYRGDEFALYRELAGRCPAPLSSWIATDNLAVASVSPETFLRVEPPDRISTFPIKGTRPRGTTRSQDEARRRELLDSPKDRAELLMIVDLERNDLGRVCRTGTVTVPELASLHSFATVHHLVARVEGRLEPGSGPADWLRATFPGGSITGAPKLRAMQILEELEPARRGFFTGSLLWFGDDGSVDSSILIRTLEFRRDRVYLGAGGGIVADSDPEEEWLESNHKAGALAAALGFEPEEAR